MKQGMIERYRQYLPVSEKTPVVTLQEGDSPLIEAKNLQKSLGIDLKLFLKYEGLNPTGSFKDRGMTLAVSKALEGGAKAVICASTGNTSASAAAYAARAGLDCVVLIPKGAIALGKLAQALIHGAKVFSVEGNFDDCLNLVREISQKYPLTLVNSINPYRIEGQKTAAFEICDALDRAPDFQAMPVGNAGNITSYWKGYKEYKEKGKIDSLPKMLGFQAEGSAPIVEGRVIKNPQTIATAIRIGNPASWKKAEEARDKSGGLIAPVTDEEILNAYKMLAELEGIFVEPASAASLAGVIKLNKQGYFNRPSDHPTIRPSHHPTIVCILTGHGLKDPDRAIKTIKEPKVLPSKVEAIVKEIGL
jgi:threonine synthase